MSSIDKRKQKRMAYRQIKVIRKNYENCNAATRAIARATAYAAKRSFNSLDQFRFNFNVSLTANS